MKNRVCTLYRVSTDKQVDHNDKNQADIPMQRKACRTFCDKMGWTIVHEEQEEGVSGHKVRAENRDKLQIIKNLARQKKFDILLVFMFDRIGRIADETPFVVEWFVKQGIEVWSTQEGQQRFDSHTDKLTNYIRFWQADGESEKTSIRTRTALGQLVEAGGFKGGLAPYGYDLVKSGRFNKRKHELYDLVVNETEAAVVRIIFDKYVHEGFGAQRIATYLNKQGYRARTGKMWHHASIRGIVCNLTYTGVLRCGESRSQELPHLQIISPELFEAAQHIRTSRANSAEQERHIPLNTRGNSLLAGNVYCGIWQRILRPRLTSSVNAFSATRWWTASWRGIPATRLRHIGENWGWRIGCWFAENRFSFSSSRGRRRYDGNFRRIAADCRWCLPTIRRPTGRGRCGCSTERTRQALWGRIWRD